MNIFVDENVPLQIVELLRAEGYQYNKSYDNRENFRRQHANEKNTRSAYHYWSHPYRTLYCLVYVVYKRLTVRIT
ncbi:MAG: hypothetical protein M3Z24_15370 [Chloroflexota bacterium]|nr:hypothetical protein [Chloroflexota bacterium]